MHNRRQKYSARTSKSRFIQIARLNSNNGRCIVWRERSAARSPEVIPRSRFLSVARAIFSRKFAAERIVEWRRSISQRVCCNKCFMTDWADGWTRVNHCVLSWTHADQLTRKELNWFAPSAMRARACRSVRSLPLIDYFIITPDLQSQDNPNKEHFR